MSHSFRITDIEGFKKDAKYIECGNFKGSLVTNNYVEIPFRETEAKVEFDRPPEFPSCCSFHSGVFQLAINLFEKFPNCCDDHRKLITQKWFNKKDYAGLPRKLINTLSYCEWHMVLKIDRDDWYADITDYFEYSIQSFGSLPANFGSPLGLSLFIENLEASIRRVKIIPKEKKIRLIDFIETSLNPIESSNSDLSLLLDTYNSWLKIFPFELSLFCHLKERFYRNIPILKEEPIRNRYTGLTKGKLKSKSELIAGLIAKTEELLHEINSLRIFEKGKLSDIKRLQLEMINSTRKLELTELKQKIVDERNDYLKILKQWFDGEKRYLVEISPFINEAQKNDENLTKQQNCSFHFDKELERISKSENKFWKGVPMSKVIEHFHVFTTKKNKLGGNYLTQEQFVRFLDRGFLGNSKIPKQKFSHSNSEKGFLIKRFYEFFNLCVSEYGDVSKKFKYINLISECFENWDKSSIEAYFRPNKTKQTW